MIGDVKKKFLGVGSWLSMKSDSSQHTGDQRAAQTVNFPTRISAKMTKVTLSANYTMINVV